MSTRNMYGSVRSAGARAGAGALLAAALGMPVAGQVTSRVSVDSGGAQGNDHSNGHSISADDRYVAFQSAASDLVGGDTNGVWDIFVRDRLAGTTERVSVDSGGAQGNGDSRYTSVSADGRYVAFESSSSDLVPGDTNGESDVFVRDRLAGTTERVSITSGGAQGNLASWYCSMSADGRYVAFYGDCSNLVPGDTNGRWDVFVRDRLAGTTERVSVDSSGAQGTGTSYSPSISADGRYVAFESSSSDLVLGDTNGVWDVFVRDRLAGTTERMTVDSNGAEVNFGGQAPSISADGRYVGFQSNAFNLVVGDTNGLQDAFVRDRLAGTTERVSVDSGGAQGNGDSRNPSISADGRYVAFGSLASNLVILDLNGTWDVFVRDRLAGATQRVSVDSSGMQGNGSSDYPSISVDGRYVGFDSLASNLVGGDTNGVWDAFVRDRLASGFTSLCDPGVAGVIACPCSNPPAGAGRGCDNFGAGPVDSGTLTATGVAYLSMDSVVLHAAGENSTSLTVFWTGTTLIAPPGVVHGAGVRCVSGLKRLYAGSASGGAISRPAMGDPSVSTVGGPISAGETRYYFTIYRDPNAAVPCGDTASTFNLTNAGSITWNL